MKPRWVIGGELKIEEGQLGRWREFIKRRVSLRMEAS